MSLDIVGTVANFMLDAGLDTESTSTVVEVLDEFDNVIRGSLALRISEALYNNDGCYPEPHWKIFEQGYQAGIAKAVEIIEGKQ